jgi:hypothetical protein
MGTAGRVYRALAPSLAKASTCGETVYAFAHFATGEPTPTPRPAALEILDSRGQPTLAVTLRLGDGTSARAGVPSGASTGSREAVELRDGDRERYAGRGVLGAVTAVNIELADLLWGQSWSALSRADQAMIDLDGTANKSRLGANANAAQQDPAERVGDVPSC